MRKNLSLITFLFTFLGFTSCVTIPEEEPEIKLGSFSSISSNGGITITLIQGAENQVISSTLNQAAYQVNNEQLSINASMGKITIAARDLDLLYANGSTIKNSGPLVLDTLKLSIHAGSAEFTDLTLQTLDLYLQNTGTYKFSGYANVLELSMINNPIFKGYDLITDSTFVNSQAHMDSEINVRYKLNASIMGNGNILYKGNPAIVETSYMGYGRALPQ